MSPIKETNFFLGDDNAIIEEVDATRKAKSIRSRVTTFDDYQTLFEGVIVQRARGEASPKYLYYPETAQRIKAKIPHAKIIAILRHPVDRAYSDFLHQIRDNREEFTDFALALRAEPKRIEKGWNSKYHYRNRGFYFRQLLPYYAAFGEDNMYIYLYEDLRKDPANFMRHLFDVLGVDANFVPDLDTEHNVSGVPKNRLLHGLHSFLSNSNQSTLKDLGKQLLPTTLRRQFKERVVGDLQKKNLSKPSLAPETRADLLQSYKEDILQLQNLIGRDLTHWLE